MNVGEIRGPVKSEFGYHIVKLDEVEPAHGRSFEEARAELEQEYRHERAQAIFYDRSQKLADQAFTALTELQTVAKDLGLPLHEVHGFTRQGGGQGGEDLGASREVLDAAFSEDVLDKHQNSPMIGIGDEKAVVLRVTAHHTPEQKPLADVHADIETQLKEQAQRAAAAKKGAEAVKQLQTGASWNQVVAELKAQPTGKRFVGRQEAGVPMPVVRQAFTMPRTEMKDGATLYRGVTLDNGDYAIVAISAVRSGDAAAQAAQEIKTREQTLARQVGAEEFAAYMDALESRAKITRNPNAFE